MDWRAITEEERVDWERGRRLRIANPEALVAEVNGNKWMVCYGIIYEGAAPSIQRWQLYVWSASSVLPHWSWLAMHGAQPDDFAAYIEKYPARK